VKFIIIDQYAGFPGERYIFSFTMSSFIQFAVHKLYIELMSDCSRLYS
jgi:hypothetical protein